MEKEYIILILFYTNMDSQSIPVKLNLDFILALDRIASREMSSRNRIIRVAIKEFIEKDGNTKKF
jgi:metal-responsive CopG/Arc/MetJ family transcriptional regulator